MLYSDSGARKPQSHAGARLVESRVVEARADDVIHGRAMCNMWNHGADEEPRDRCVPVRKVRDIRIVFESHARKARGSDPRQTDVSERIDRRSGIDRDAQIG